MLWQLNNFVGQLNDTAMRARGVTRLALPLEDVSNVENCLQDREILQRLEALVINWTRQVKEILMLQVPRQCYTTA